MHHFRTFTICATLICGLAACATKQTIPEPMVQGVQRIGVVSTIGDSLEYRQVAAVSVGNDTQEVSLAGLGFDRFVKKQVTKNFKSRYAPEPVKAPKGETNPAAIAAAAAASHPGGPLDAYVVVVPAVRPPRLVAEQNAAVGNAGGMFGAVGYLVAAAVAGDHHDYSGLGLYRSSQGTYSYAIADLVLVDGRTFEELRRVPLLERLATDQPAVVDGAETLGDMRAIAGGDAWPDHFEQFSKTQKKEVSDSFSVLLRVALAQSLRQAGLIY